MTGSFGCRAALWSTLLLTRVAQAEEPVEPQVIVSDAAIVTMRDVVGTVAVDGAVVAAEHGGRLVVWQDGLPTGWARLDGHVDALGAAGSQIIAVGHDNYWIVDPTTLGVIRVGEVDGHTACTGGASVWYWSHDSGAVHYADASGVMTFPVADSPYSRARCSLGPESAALVWDDGIEAVLLASDGTSLRSDWSSQGLPVGAWDGSWQIALPSPWSAVATCDDVTLRTDSCEDVSPGALAPFLGPIQRRVTDARIVRNGVVLQDGAGWTVVAGTTPPSVIRFDHRTLGLTEGPAPAAIVCEALPTRLVARDVLTGAALDTVEISECPVGLRSRSGRVVAQHREEVAVWDDVARVFVSRQADSFSLRVAEGWATACAGPAWTVVRDDERLIGPTCSRLELVDITAADGTIGALAVCEDGELATALRPDGGRADISSLAGTCETGFRPPVRTAGEGVARGGVEVTDGRVVLAGASGQLVLQTAGDAVLLFDEDSIWASGTVWDRVVWSDGPSVRSLRDPLSEFVWDESILRDAVGRPR